MAQVRRRWIDNYANALESLSDKAKAGLSAELAALDWDRPVADVREELVPIMQAWCGVSAETASLLGAEFYQGLRNDTPLRTRYVAEPAGSGYSDDCIEGAVHAIVQPLAERGQEGVSQVVSGLLERLGYEVKSAAGETVFENGRRDPERVRYARVPRGSKSYPSGCPFCQMLASRGFKYLSELTAGGDDPSHYHDSCQCMVVPGFGEDPRAEGYDPHDYDEGYQEWLNRGLPEEVQDSSAVHETRMRSVSGPTSFSAQSTSPFIEASDFEELERILDERYDSVLFDELRELAFESVRGFLAGMDDVLSRAGNLARGALDVHAERLGRLTLAQTRGGRVTLNSELFSSVFEQATSTGRHEAAHLIEFLLSDDGSTVDAKVAHSILSSALRAYNREHPDRRLSLDQAISSVTNRPAIEASRYRTEKRAKRALWSEGFAYCIEDAFDNVELTHEFSGYVLAALNRSL